MTATDFDPYYKWLGIPPEEQPPTLYRLLGVVQFEADPDVIANAVNQRMVHLRQLLRGDHAALAEQLLKGVGQAKATLLNPREKTRYDQSLIPGQAEAAAEEPESAIEQFVVEPTFSRRVEAKKPKRFNAGPLLIRSGAFVLLAVVLAFFLSGGHKAFMPATHSAAAPAASSPSIESGDAPVVEAAPSPTARPIASTPAAPQAEPPSASDSLAAGDEGADNKAAADRTAGEHMASDETAGDSIAQDDGPADDRAAEAMEEKPVAGRSRPMVAMKSDEDQPSEEMPDKSAETVPAEKMSSESMPTESMSQDSAGDEMDSAESDTIKTPPPNKEALDAAVKKVRASFKTEFGAAKTPDEKVELAKRLLTLGREEDVDDPAKQFALLKGAIGLATAGGNFSLALEVWSVLGEHFDVDVPAGQWEMLGKSLKSKKSDELKAALEEFSDEAADHDRYDLARQAIEALKTLSKPDEAKPLDARLAELDDRAEKYDAAKEALATLKTNPADPDANFIAGQYVALIKLDWDQGLNLLARSSDDTLKSLAKSEFAQPSKPKEQVKLGDAWWEYAGQQQDAALKSGAKARARFWYQLALPELTGPDQGRIQRRAMPEGRDRPAKQANDAPDSTPKGTAKKPAEKATKPAQKSAGSQMASSDDPAKPVKKKSGKAVDGKIYAMCDDEFELRVNGTPVMKGKKREINSSSMSFMPGDVITVKATNAKGQAGFWCTIKFANGLVVTTADGWKAYVPPDPDQWAQLKKVRQAAPVIEANSDWLETMGEDGENAFGAGTPPIWAPGGDDVCYLSYTIGPLKVSSN